MLKFKGHLALFIAVLGCLIPGTHASGADTLRWETNRNLVTADIKSSELMKVLEGIASATGWKVLVEPETLHTVSAKFKDLPPGEALHLLLGDVNFALIPGTNSSERLFVFRTTMGRATQLVAPVKIAQKPSQPKVIPNQLIVRLKPGAKIDELAKLLGAKVVGKLDSLNAYQLQFDDQAATDAAHQQLSSNNDVSSVEDNYSINRPETAQPVNGSAPMPQLQLNPPTSGSRVLIGLIDTAVQPLGNGLDQFLQKQVSLAGDYQPDPNTPTHGTSMAETMLRTLQTLGNGSTSINIQPYDIYGASEGADTWRLAQAIAQAVNAGANPISMSLGSSGDSQIVRDLVQEGTSKGVRFYAAVGNDAGQQMDYPAADSGAIPVTALERDGQIASYANQSGQKAVGALGTVPVIFNGQSYLVSGTSPATAIVAATAGNMMESGPMSSADAATKIQSAPTRTTVPKR